MLEPTADPTFGSRIDFHVHIYDSLSRPEPRELGRLERLAARSGIGRVVFLASATGILEDMKPNPPLVRAVNSYTLAVMEAMPQFVTGFCYLSPAHSVEFIEDELERCIVRGGMKGVKLEAALKASDPRMDPLMERIVGLGVPLLHHTWYKAAGEGRNESTPADLVALGRGFPRARIVLAHLGGIRQRGVLDIKALPNLWVDTSGSQPEDGLVEYAARRLGAERILYGSDWPVRDFGVQTGRILGASLGDRERELIFRENALDLLGER